MRTKALIIIFFVLMLSAATLASEQHRRVAIRAEAVTSVQNSEAMNVHEKHEFHIVGEEVDVTN